MIKLLKYLKPYVLLIVIAIGLLYTEAMMNLSLPDYMSKIVNVGIQQNGIENGLPKVISESTFTDMQYFMTDEDYELVNSYYKELSAPQFDEINEKNIRTAIEAKNENVFYLEKKANKDDAVNKIVGKAMMLGIFADTEKLTAFSATAVLPSASDKIKVYELMNIPGFKAEYNDKSFLGLGYWDQTLTITLNGITKTYPIDGKDIEIVNRRTYIEPYLLKDFGVDYENMQAQTTIQSLGDLSSELSVGVMMYLKATDTEEFLKTLEIIETTFERFSDMGSQLYTSGTKYEYFNVLNINKEEMQNGYIVNIGVIMLFISLLSGIATIIVGYIAAVVSAGTAQKIRNDVFAKVESFSSAEMDKFSTASLITRSTNDITQIQTLIFMLIRMVIYAPIMGIGGVIRALDRSVSMSWIIALIVIIVIGVVSIVFAIALPKFLSVQKLIDKLNLVSRENLSGMMVIRAFNTQKSEEERFDKVNVDLTAINSFINRVFVIVMPIAILLMNLMTILVIWVGSHQVAEATMQVGDMIAFMQYAIQIMFAFIMMSMMFIMIPRASVSGNRINEVLSTDNSVKDPENPVEFKADLKGLVEFNDVCFKYSGASDNVLNNISFSAIPGETTAIIGSTGSGKSTIVNLIPRFYDVTSGSITVDSIDVKNVTQKSLRNKIGFIPQKGILFSGTVASNLYMREIETKTDSESDSNTAVSTEEMTVAATVAQAIDFINEKPEQFNTSISQSGSNVSGGQKQRLSIARALMKKPDIFIFDDSFSALDFKTDASLRKALKEHTGNSTVIVVAQRISTIMTADKIIVLNQGNIVGTGTHKELLDSCGEYREIALSQLSKEDLQ